MSVVPASFEGGNNCLYQVICSTENELKCCLPKQTHELGFTIIFTTTYLMGRVHGDMGMGCFKKNVWAIITILHLDIDAHHGKSVSSTEQIYI